MANNLFTQVSLQGSAQDPIHTSRLDLFERTGAIRVDTLICENISFTFMFWLVQGSMVPNFTYISYKEDEYFQKLFKNPSI